MSTKTKGGPPEHVEVFFDTRDGSFWYRLSGRYVNLKKSELKLHFRTMGLSDALYHNRIQEIEWPFWNAITTRQIDYAGPIAGHRTGIFADGSGRKFLVTDEAGGVWADLPSKKEFKSPEFFIAFINELLPGDQSEYFCHWLAIALRSLRRSDFQPGQAIILAGPRRCGKSLLQAIITEILGGRMANPSQYLFQKTDFNYELAGAEHWAMEDPRTTTDMRSRRDFGAAIKEATVNRSLSITRKNKDALSLPVARRLTISVNDEPENLAVSPPIESSIEDKLFLFHCKPVEEALQPFRIVSGTRSLLLETRHDGELDQAGLWAHVRKEIPMIRAWLLRSYKTIPSNLRDDRFGIKFWHHPDLLDELNEMSPDSRLERLIIQTLFPKGEVSVSRLEYTAMELEKVLRAGEFAFEAEKIIRGNLGSQMGRLAKSHPHLVIKPGLRNGLQPWLILNPHNSENKNAKR